ncbi:hypothetical protein AMJ40_03855 [candidate division TA06 bacterium DG_26]|uniref:Ribosomal RNA small subunit methyltransferase A n=1 Tax=candidate division TA06 bacterium DG_26 TaxID=1703771 RepID=A0A0S7WIS5_UNCT6|nr:MAG: hypothetical protein AMJ40_03855 [candidate division TA06 bacterium DG_26]
MTERNYVKAVLTDFKPSKRLGQHFLVHESVADRIVEASEISPRDVCLEIGPGLGVLTSRLVSRALLVVAVEVDRKLCALLGQRVRAENLALLESDILTLDCSTLSTRYAVGGFKVVSNLPYRVTAPILFWLIENREHIVRAILTVQLEVAERLMADPGSKAYGVTTLKVSYYAATSLLFRIGRNAFFPPPEVDSAVITLDFLRKPKVRVGDESHLFNLIDRSFQSRRKMLRACLRIGFGLKSSELEKIQMASSIDLRRRGETLSLDEFAVLSEEMRRVRGR